VDSPNELDDYAPVVKFFRPVVLSVSGGEPLMRKNYDKLLLGVRPYCHYLSIITNGALLNEESAERLSLSGVDQISVSLDYLSKKHDENRRITGLYEHICEMVPRLASKGYKLSLNTVIMESNLDEILEIAYRAKQWGVDVSFSAYCQLKSRESDDMVVSENWERLNDIVTKLKKLKATQGNIKNSHYYLDRIPQYFKEGHIPDCRAGFNWVQITPDGYVQQCSELPRLYHYKEYDSKGLCRTSCTKCWYTCRGEMEANPWSPRRLLELIRAK
jgi:MoaA/NifB/PqqE/SkfB family radical SAM enzyme